MNKNIVCKNNICTIKLNTQKAKKSEKEKIYANGAWYDNKLMNIQYKCITIL